MVFCTVHKMASWGKGRKETENQLELCRFDNLLLVKMPDFWGEVKKSVLWRIHTLLAVAYINGVNLAPRQLSVVCCGRQRWRGVTV